MEDTISLDLEVDQDLINNQEILYWEKDDINPNQIIYDLENDRVIIPDSEDDIVVTPTNKQDSPNLIIKNVSGTRYRNNR